MISPRLTLISALTKAAQAAINDVLANGDNSLSPPIARPTDETSAVAAVVLAGTLKLGRSWASILGPLGYAVHTHGVFCHGSPKVRFQDSTGAAKVCELADLLIVVDHFSDGRSQRRAALTQAKMIGPSGVVDGKSNQSQLDLYMNWHPFDFALKGYNSNLRNFGAPGQPGSRLDSGRYGGIGLGSIPPLWRQISPAPVMQVAEALSWGSFLVGMAVEAKGCGRQAHICASPGYGAAALKPDTWSATIAELLDVTFNSSFAYKKAVASGQVARGVSAMAYSDAMANLGETQGVGWPIGVERRPSPPKSPPSGIVEESPEDGMNILVIQLVAEE